MALLLLRRAARQLLLALPLPHRRLAPAPAAHRGLHPDRTVLAQLVRLSHLVAAREALNAHRTAPDLQLVLRDVGEAASVLLPREVAAPARLDAARHAVPNRIEFLLLRLAPLEAAPLALEEHRAVAALLLFAVRLSPLATAKSALHLDRAPGLEALVLLPLPHEARGVGADRALRDRRAAVAPRRGKESVRKLFPDPAPHAALQEPHRAQLHPSLCDRRGELAPLVPSEAPLDLVRCFILDGQDARRFGGAAAAHATVAALNHSRAAVEHDAAHPIPREPTANDGLDRVRRAVPLHSALRFDLARPRFPRDCHGALPPVFEELEDDVAAAPLQVLLRLLLARVPLHHLLPPPDAARHLVHRHFHEHALELLRPPALAEHLRADGGHVAVILDPLHFAFDRRGQGRELVVRARKLAPEVRRRGLRPEERARRGARALRVLRAVAATNGAALERKRG